MLVVPVIVAIALSTFAWSAANLEPRDLPPGVAGPAQATVPVEARLAERKGAFDVHRYADAAAATSTAIHGDGRCPGFDAIRRDPTLRTCRART